MSQYDSQTDDVGPGFLDAAHRTVREGVQGYLIGFALATVLTVHNRYAPYLASGNPGGAHRPRHRADRRAPGILSAYHYRSRQH